MHILGAVQGSAKLATSLRGIFNIFNIFSVAENLGIDDDVNCAGQHSFTPRLYFFSSMLADRHATSRPCSLAWAITFAIAYAICAVQSIA